MNKKKFNIDDVMKTHNYVGGGFCPWVSTHTFGVNAYFDPRKKTASSKTQLCTR